MSEPIYYNQQIATNYFNLQPSVVKGRANVGCSFEKRYLYNQIFSGFKFRLPKEWDINYFRFWLFEFGSIAGIYTNEFGWICQPYGIQKRGLYYQPAEITVWNQFLPDVKLGIIGVNAEIIKIFPDYFGIDDLVTKYAEQLAQIDRSINVNLMNSNVTALFQASNKKQADTVKEAYGKATTGEPLVVINRDVLNGEGIEPMFPDVSKTFIVDRLQDAKRRVLNEFLTKIGIRNANYEKKERLNSMEVSENNDETASIVTIMYENILEGMEKLNAISGLDLGVELRYDYSDNEMGGEENA